jgi:hypothetical protein
MYMKEKLKKLGIKKIFQEYNLLLVDDEYKKEMVSEYRNEFLTEIENKKNELGIESNKNIVTSGETKEKTKIIIDIDDESKKKLKKIYKDIVKKTHPDKTNSSDMVELYMQATEAHDNHNLFELYSICLTLDIPVELDENDFDTLNGLIDNKKKELKSIETSFIWLWVHAKNDMEKESIIKLFIEKNG